MRKPQQTVSVEPEPNYPSSLRYPLTYAFLTAVDNPYKMIHAIWVGAEDKRRGEEKGVPSCLIFDESKAA